MPATRTLALLTMLAAVVALPASAQRPEVISLPTGFQPEGIAIGKGRTFFVGSIPTGAVYRGNLRTGEGAVLVEARAGRSAVGLAVDRRHRVFVAGGATGRGFVYDGETGELLAEYQLAGGPPTFVNDVVVTRDAAWFTDSQRPVLYRVPISRNALGTQADVQEVPLSGDFVFQPNAFNANGIDATPDGRTLVIVQSSTAQLFRVDAETGSADRIELTRGDVAFGDGVLLDGKTLYVVQNRLNRVAVIKLHHGKLSSGTIVGHLTHPALDVPSTIDEQGRRLYVVNARFGTPNPGSAEYSVVQLRKWTEH